MASRSVPPIDCNKPLICRLSIHYGTPTTFIASAHNMEDHKTTAVIVSRSKAKELADKLRMRSDVHSCKVVQYSKRGAIQGYNIRLVPCDHNGFADEAQTARYANEGEVTSC